MSLYVCKRCVIGYVDDDVLIVRAKSRAEAESLADKHGGNSWYVDEELKQDGDSLVVYDGIIH